MKRSAFGAMLLAILVAGCNQGSGLELAPSNPLLEPAPTPFQPFILFEDFEAAAPKNPVPYGASAVPASSWGTLEFVSPTHGWHLVTSATSWGAGINIESNYGILNLTGKTNLVFSLKADTTASFTVRLSESKAGNENENWVSPSQNITGGSGWQQYSLVMSAFTEDDCGCGPCGCLGNGNNARDYDAVDRFEIHFAAPLTNAGFDLDDIRIQ